MIYFCLNLPPCQNATSLKALQVQETEIFQHSVFLFLFLNPLF